MRIVRKVALFGLAALGLGFVALLLVYVWPGGLATGWGISAPSRYDRLAADMQSLNAQIKELKPAPSPIPEAPTAVPEVTKDVAAEGSGDTVTVNSPDPVRWTLAELAKYFDNIEGWVLPLGTHFATDLSNGRYEAVASKPVGPQSNGTDAGWCGEGQLDCPPHLGLYQVMVTENVEAMMDIATRIQVVSDNGGSVRFQWRFNTETRTAAELVDDYNVAASGGQLGLFIATSDPLMEEGTVVYKDEETLFGYSCWDCLAHTRGPDQPVPYPLTDFETFGPDTATLGDSLLPGVVIPIPSPEEDPDFMVDLTVNIPKGTQVVFWFGRYDVSDPPG